jgi:serpin B
MGKRIQIAVGVLLIVLGVTAWWVLRAPEPDLQEIEPLRKANTEFAFDLFGRLRSTSSNVVFSPYSVSAALAMARAGARGQTAQEIEKALRWPQTTTNMDGLFGRLGSWLKRAQSKGNAELIVANSVWIQANVGCKSDFLERLKADYQATLRTVDFLHRSDQARAAINQWADENTRHKIQNLVAPGDVNELTGLVVADAIYFKGAWAKEFREEATRPGEFIVSSNRTVSVPMMGQSDEFAYFSNTNLQCLILPYKREPFDMVILLPSAGGHSDHSPGPEHLGTTTLDQLEKNLNEADFTAWTSLARKTEIYITIPKFKMSSGYTLNATLQELGVRTAFDVSRADFSNINSSSNSLFLSKILHQAIIEVDEKGSEAAAATIGTAATSNISEVLLADHPFLFFIRETRTGTILFLGRVMDPTAGATL